MNVHCLYFHTVPLVQSCTVQSHLMSKYRSEGSLKGIEFTLRLEQNVKPYYYDGIEKLLLASYFPFNEQACYERAKLSFDYVSKGLLQV